MVPEPLIHSLAAAGFQTPSPVQQAAIPLGRLGSDLIVQAKSGTGKTVTFAVICLERVKLEVAAVQVRAGYMQGFRQQQGRQCRGSRGCTMWVGG